MGKRKKRRQLQRKRQARRERGQASLVSRQGFSSSQQRERRVSDYRASRRLGYRRRLTVSRPWYPAYVNRMMVAKGYHSEKEIKDAEWKCINEYFAYEQGRHRRGARLDRSKNGPLSRWLECLGYRPPDAEYAVGES